MKFLKKNKHLLIVLALFIALAAIAAGCTGKASGMAAGGCQLRTAFACGSQ